MSFPRRCRLKSNQTIRAISRAPIRRKRWSAFRSSWAPAPSADAPTQFAFVVSRHAGAAHRRNRIKRRLREAARLHKNLWPQGAAIVFITHGDTAARMRFTELADIVKKALVWVRGELRREAKDQSG